MPAQAPVLSWTALSEIVFGKIVSKSLSVNAVKPESFIEPYPRGIKYLRTSKNPTSDQLVKAVGLAAYQSAVHGAEQMNGLKVNWADLLHQAALNYQLGVQLERSALKLKAGETVDMGQIKKQLRQYDEGLPRLTQLSAVKPNKSDYVLTGYEPLDKYVGGLPISSLTLVIGPPGTGKTYYFLQIARHYARRKKKVILFSLEMTMQQVARRCMKSMGFTKAEADYVWICDDILSPTDITSVVAQAGDADLIGVDFAELMMVGDRTEQTMSEAYWVLATGAKNMAVPILCLGQQNRASLADMLPGLGASRNTGMGDILTALEIGLFNQSKVLRQVEQRGLVQPPFVLQPGNGAHVVIKARYGTATKEIGAIEVPFNNERGWGETAVKWHSLAA